MSQEQSLHRMKVQVQYHGTEPTLVRPYVNMPKINVAPKQVVEVDVSVANVLRRLPIWSVVGEPSKVDIEEEEKIQASRKEIEESERLKAERLAGDKPQETAPESPKEGSEGGEGGE